MTLFNMWSIDDLELWLPAKKKCFPTDTGLRQINKMKVLIGLDPEMYLQEQALTEKQRTLLRMLGGPHGHTISKAYKIKKGIMNGNVLQEVGESDKRDTSRT